MLNDLSDSSREALLARATEKRFKTGQTLWCAGEPGSTLGEVPFFTSARYPATAAAAEPTRCLLIDYAALERSLRVDPSVAFYLLKTLSLRVQELVDKVGQLSAQSVKARLAAYLVIRARRTSPSDRPFSLGMTQADLAEELGTVREVVVRALRSLREAGAIEPAGAARYKVVSFELLQKASEFDS